MRDIRHAHDDAVERSIRSIPLHRRKRSSTATEYNDRNLPPDGPAELPHRRRRRGGGRFWLLALIIVVVCAVLGLLLSTLFAGASITVRPRVEVVSLPATLQAQPSAPVGVLPYKLITVSRSSTISVPAQGMSHVSRPATGVVMISNSYNASSQRLIANTRFEASDGKIYRIRDSVTVPGATGTGAALKPGTISASIYADSAGPDYNKATGENFTIPGFKNDPRYTKFTAKAQGPIAGGFIGDEPAIAATDLSAAKTSLQQKLDADIRAAAAAQIPADYVAVPGTLEVVFGDLTQASAADKTATLSQSATATGIIIRQGDLASAIARNEVDHYQGEAVLFGDTSGMDVSLATTSKRSDGTITLALKGKTTLVWQFDKNALLKALVGKSKSEFEGIVKSFQPAVAKADATIRPFWQGKFPDDITKMSIKVVGEK